MATCFLHFPSPIVQFYSTSQKDQQGHLRILSNTCRNCPLLSSRNINQASKHPSFSIGPNCSTRPCFPRFASNLIHQSHSICPTNVAANGKALGPVMNRNLQPKKGTFFCCCCYYCCCFFWGRPWKVCFILNGLKLKAWRFGYGYDRDWNVKTPKHICICTRNPRTVQHIIGPIKTRCHLKHINICEYVLDGKSSKDLSKSPPHPPKKPSLYSRFPYFFYRFLLGVPT